MPLQFHHFILFQRRDDQQDAVRSHRAGLIDLVGVDDEILSQYRQCACIPRLSQIVVVALKELHVRQHRQAGGTVPGV